MYAKPHVYTDKINEMLVAVSSGHNLLAIVYTGLDC